MENSRVKYYRIFATVVGIVTIIIAFVQLWKWGMGADPSIRSHVTIATGWVGTVLMYAAADILEAIERK